MVGHALNDVPTPLGAARIIQLLGSFLQRPAIQSKVKQSHTRLGKLMASAWLGHWLTFAKPQAEVFFRSGHNKFLNQLCEQPNNRTAHLLSFI